MREQNTIIEEIEGENKKMQDKDKKVQKLLENLELNNFEKFHDIYKAQDLTVKQIFAFN